LSEEWKSCPPTTKPTTDQSQSWFPSSGINKQLTFRENIKNTLKL
jgi:hypothetical protein